MRVRNALLRYRPSTVIHMAAVHEITWCEQHPEETWSINTLGAHVLSTVLRTLRKPIRLLAFSTAAVYAPASRPLHETDPMNPVTVYGRSKRDAEWILNRAGARSGGITIVRLFNVYGPDDGTPHIIPTILQQFRSGSVEVGNLLPRRDYIHVHDVCEIVSRLLRLHERTIMCNVGTGIGTSVQDLLEIIQRHVGKPIRIVSCAQRRRQHDPLMLVADTTHLFHAIGSCRFIALSTALRELIERAQRRTLSSQRTPGRTSRH